MSVKARIEQVKGFTLYVLDFGNQSSTCTYLDGLLAAEITWQRWERRVGERVGEPESGTGLSRRYLSQGPGEEEGCSVRWLSHRNREDGGRLEKLSAS